MSNYFGLLFKV